MSRAIDHHLAEIESEQNLINDLPHTNDLQTPSSINSPLPTTLPSNSTSTHIKYGNHDTIGMNVNGHDDNTHATFLPLSIAHKSAAN